MIRILRLFNLLLLRLPVGRGGVINSADSVLFFFFGCRKLGYRSWVIPLCILLSEPASPRLLNSISSKLCHQNTQFNMYTTTSKQQEGSTCKDSYPNCFIATNSTAKLWRGAMNRGEILRACSVIFGCVSTFHLNLYTSIKLILLLLKCLNKTPTLTCK